MRDKLLILDMDNTVLRSGIDFRRMCAVVHEIFDQEGLGRYKQRTTARSMVAYEQSPDYDPALAARLWQAIEAVEAEGLRRAVAEPGAAAALAYLSQQAVVTILTNNTDQAAQENMERLGMAGHCDLIVGRDSVPFLKPAPEGFLQIMAAYPEIRPSHTLAVGDAANDAHGAQAAAIGFAAYNNSRDEDWEGWGIRPLLRLTAWNRQSCDALLQGLPWRAAGESRGRENG